MGTSWGRLPTIEGYHQDRSFLNLEKGIEAFFHFIGLLSEPDQAVTPSVDAFLKFFAFRSITLILPALLTEAYQESFIAESPQAALNIQVKQEASILRVF